jgi:radical SAM superfamily enzyme with C-terminal helix-hairpin-helix motif
LTNQVGGYFKGKQELSKVKLEANKIVIQAKAETEMAIAKSKVKMAEEGQMQNYDLDRIAMQNMESSYKDEFILAVFMVPMILAFIPVLSNYALQGFEVIQKMPTWYQYTLIGMVVVIYGMRGLLEKFLTSRLPKLK